MKASDAADGNAVSKAATQHGPDETPGASATAPGHGKS